MILYLSATGNSRHIAQLLAQATGDNRIVDFRRFMRPGSSAPEITLQENENLGFVFPVHSWGLPKGFSLLLASLKAHGYNPTQTYTYMVCTCGDDAGQTARLWRSSLRNAGICGNAAFSVFMPNTYVLLPGFDIDSQETQRKKLAEAPKAVREIAERIGNRKEGDFTHHGCCSTLKTRIVYPLFMRFMTGDKPFKASPSSCTGCGKCAALCPTGNLTVEKPKGNGKPLPAWHGNCMNCLACYHGCPNRSISYGSRTRRKGHYFFYPDKSQPAGTD